MSCILHRNIILAPFFLLLLALFAPINSLKAQDMSEQAAYDATRSALIERVNAHNARIASYNQLKDKHGPEVDKYNQNVQQKTYLQTIIEDPTRDPDEITTAFAEWQQIVNWFESEGVRIDQEGKFLETESKRLDAEKINIAAQIDEIKKWKLRLDAGTVAERPLNLSAKTVIEFKKLIEHIADANERQMIGNIILAISPFSSLLGKPDMDTILSIGQTDWAALGTASQGLNVHLKSQLKMFCELEAVAQNNSPVDFKFWRKLAEQFNQ